jgi:hypothetical protein
MADEITPEGQFHVYGVAFSDDGKQRSQNHIESFEAKADAVTAAEAVAGMVFRGGTFDATRAEHLGAAPLIDFSGAKPQIWDPELQRQYAPRVSDDGGDVLTAPEAPTTTTEQADSSAPNGAAVEAADPAAFKFVPAAATILAGFIQRPDFNFEKLDGFVTTALVMSQRLWGMAEGSVSPVRLRPEDIKPAPVGEQATTTMPAVQRGKARRIKIRKGGRSVYVDADSAEGRAALASDDADAANGTRR